MQNRTLNAARRAIPWCFLAIILVAGCAAGDPQFTSKTPAGFWVGVWHGIISCVTLILGIWNHGVKVYEVDNTGGWYDFGFLIGVTMLWGHRSVTRSRKRKLSDAEWQEISRKVEAKFKRKIQQWAEAEPDEDWNVVEQKAEEKLKRKIREWADQP